jgi:DNA polymerase III alpha subunit
MQALFADVPSALANTVEIAQRCNLTLVLGKPQLPDFPTPVMAACRSRAYFRQASFEGLEERLRCCTRTRPSASAAAALCGAAGVRDQHHPEDGLPRLLS